VAVRSLSSMELTRTTAQRDRLNKTVIDNEKRYALFVEHTDDLVLMINSDGILTYVSPAGERLFGYAMENLIGHLYGEFIHPDDLKIVMDALGRSFNEGPHHTTSTLEFRIRHADGSWEWLSASGYVTKDCEDCPSYFIGIARDITGRKKHRRGIETVRGREILDTQRNQRNYSLLRQRSQNKLDQQSYGEAFGHGGRRPDRKKVLHDLESR